MLALCLPAAAQEAQGKAKWIGGNELVGQAVEHAAVAAEDRAAGQMRGLSQARNSPSVTGHSWQLGSASLPVCLCIPVLLPLVALADALPGRR